MVEDEWVEKMTQRLLEIEEELRLNQVELPEEAKHCLYEKRWKLYAD